jgi:hypothetical protein
LGKRWVLCYRILKVANTLFDVRSAISLVVQDEPALQISLIGFRRNLARSDKSGALLARDVAEAIAKKVEVSVVGNSEIIRV